MSFVLPSKSITRLLAKWNGESLLLTTSPCEWFRLVLRCTNCLLKELQVIVKRHILIMQTWFYVIPFCCSCGNYWKEAWTFTYNGGYLLDNAFRKKCQKFHDGFSVTESHAIPSCPCLLHWRYYFHFDLIFSHMICVYLFELRYSVLRK